MHDVFKEDIFQTVSKEKMFFPCFCGLYILESFSHLFGIFDSGFCAPNEIIAFDAAQRASCTAKTQKKNTAGKFILAVREICAFQDKQTGAASSHDAAEHGVTEDTEGAQDNGSEIGEDKQVDKESEADNKQGNSLTQLVTLNQQDDVVPLSEGGVSEDEVREDGEKDWSERRKYYHDGGRMGSESEPQEGGDSKHKDVEGHESLRGNKIALAKGKTMPTDSDISDSGRRRTAFGNALKRINQTSEKTQVERRTELRNKMKGKSAPSLDHGRSKKKKPDSRADNNKGHDTTGAVNGTRRRDSLTTVKSEVEMERSLKGNAARAGTGSQEASLAVQSKSQGSPSRHPGGEEVDLENGVHETSKRDTTLSDDDGLNSQVSFRESNNNREAHSKKYNVSVNVKQEGDGSKTQVNKVVSKGPLESDKEVKVQKKDRIKMANKINQVGTPSGLIFGAFSFLFSCKDERVMMEVCWSDRKGKMQSPGRNLRTMVSLVA
jgi:hypothetical protein